MADTIRFKRFDPEKFIQVASYFTTKCPGMTKKKLLKLVYFADKKHLLRYGRPVLSDHYVNMDQGPVASNAYDIIKSSNRIDPEVLERFAEHITIQGGYRLISRRAAGTTRLTESDLEVLDEVIRDYGRMSADRLSALSHRDKTWRTTKRSDPIDYRLFFETSDEVTMGELVEEDQLVRTVVNDARFSEEPTPA